MSSESANQLPKYIVLEGIDGTGKSTLAAALAAWLRASGAEVVVTEEPTRGEFGLRIRKLLSDPVRCVPVEEWLHLFEEDRREHMASIVRPALARGAWVVQDRSFYSTAAYQGAQGADMAEILRRNRSFAIEPGIVLLLVLDPAISLARTRSREAMQAEVFEREDFLSRVSEVFASIKAPNITRLDASAGPEEVLAAARKVVTERFDLAIS